MADGKIHFVASGEVDQFNIEPSDEFYTAIFAKDPFEGVNSE